MTFEYSKCSGDNPDAPNFQAIDNSRLQLILALSPAVIYTCRPDGDYGATFISENIRTQLGYDPSDFIEDPRFWSSKIHPDDKPTIFESLTKLFEVENQVHEYRFLHKDGTYRWMRDEIRLLKTQDGKPVELVGSWTDITERKTMENSLRDSQARLEEAQRIANLGSWAWDIISGEILWSDEVFRIFGVDSQTFSPTYKSFLDCIHPEDRGCVDEAVQRAVKENVPYGIDHRIIKPDGSTRYVYEQGQVTYSKDGEPVHMVGTVLDITDRKRAEEVLRENDRIKTEFVKTVAHEFRTPLTAIQGFSELLLTNNQISLEEQELSLRYIYERILLLSDMVTDILDIARIESGGALSIKRSPCPVTEIFRQVEPFFKAQFSHHRLDVTLAAENTLLNVDKGKIGQVLENLLSNAVKFSPSGSLVDIRGELVEKSYRISVADQGIGMTPEQEEKVFDKFYRADTSNTAVSGVGLGMSIVKNIVEAHGGRIWVESELNRGTTVNFTIPLAQDIGN